MSLVTNFLFITVFYLIGSIPFALILTKLLGHGDIRNIGSGNVGATNVLRTGNKYLAFAVLCLDIAKGLLPFLILKLFYDTNTLHSIFLCHFAILGHIFPIWLKFKGGKGIATYLGIILAISFDLGIIFGLSWLIILFIFKFSSLSSIISTFLVFIYSLFLDSFSLSSFLLIIFIIVIYTHKENILRIKNKKENKINL